MLPFLIPVPDLEPETGVVGTVRLPYAILLNLLGRPNLERSPWTATSPGGSSAPAAVVS